MKNLKRSRGMNKIIKRHGNVINKTKSVDNI